MSWAAQFEFEFEPVIAMFDAVEGELKRWPQDDLFELAALAQSLIDERTTQGLDMYYNGFEPYSEAYRKWKRQQKELGDGDAMAVDLTLEGHMLAAMTPQIRGRAAVVGFTDRRQAMKALAHHEGRGHLPERPWLGVAEGTKDWEKLQEEALFLMTRRIEGLGTFK